MQYPFDEMMENMKDDEFPSFVTPRVTDDAVTRFANSIEMTRDSLQEAETSRLMEHLGLDAVADRARIEKDFRANTKELRAEKKIILDITVDGIAQLSIHELWSSAGVGFSVERHYLGDAISTEIKEPDRMQGKK